MSRPEGAPLRRTAARILLLDDRDRVLLFRGFDPGDPEAGEWWFTPGGGIDPGESPLEAARRELFEETGMREAVLGPRLWTRVVSFTFEGVAIEQRELFFLGRTTRGEVDTAGFTDLERRSVTEHRWWTADELRRTTELVYPAGLGSLVTALLREGPPPSPLSID